MRFIAQAIRTGQILDPDMPITDPTVAWKLSGPTEIKAKLTPEDTALAAYVKDKSLDAWATWIHVEDDNGTIQASGVLQPGAIQGETYNLTALGVSAYPTGMMWRGALTAAQIDPLEVVRRIWAHLQSYPNGNLGVTVSPDVSPVLLGELSVAVYKPDGITQDTNPDGTPKFTEPKPYVLQDWSNVDCGREIDNLAKTTPFDFVEQVGWDAGKTMVTHRIQLGYPRTGVRQTGLRVAGGENLLAAFVLEETPGYYASEVIVSGKGEGKDQIRGSAVLDDGARLRRTFPLVDATIPDTGRATRLAQQELVRRRAYLTIGETVLDATHVNAPLGSFVVGDELLITDRVEWFGEVSLWHRVLAMVWKPADDTLTVSWDRAERFAYGATVVAGPVAKIATLVDSFNGPGLATQWSDPGGNVTISGGRAALTTTPGFNTRLQTSLSYDATNSTFYAATTPPQPAGGFGEFRDWAMFEYINDSNVIGFVTGVPAGGGLTLYMRRTLGGVFSDTTIPYDPVAHAYTRLREAAGTMYWETSPDATTWTVQRSMVHQMTLTAVLGFFQIHADAAGFFGGSSSTGYVAAVNAVS